MDFESATWSLQALADRCEATLVELVDHIAALTVGDVAEAVRLVAAVVDVVAAVVAAAEAEKAKVVGRGEEEAVVAAGVVGELESSNVQRMITPNTLWTLGSDQPTLSETLMWPRGLKSTQSSRS